jgi:hypothetical protein
MNENEETTFILQRYEQGKWDRLDTIKTGEDDQYIYYQANTTSGFSSFAITSSEVKPTEANVSQTVEKNMNQPDPNKGELSIQKNPPKKSNVVSGIDWHKYSGAVKFFILFIVVFFIGLALREKRNR